jgi:hypothetical protein
VIGSAARIDRERMGRSCEIQWLWMPIFLYIPASLTQLRTVGSKYEDSPCNVSCSQFLLIDKPSNNFKRRRDFFNERRTDRDVDSSAA